LSMIRDNLVPAGVGAASRAAGVWHVSCLLMVGFDPALLPVGSGTTSAASATYSLECCCRAGHGVWGVKEGGPWPGWPELRFQQILRGR
jgi:hypothetical protein